MLLESEFIEETYEIQNKILITIVVIVVVRIITKVVMMKIMTILCYMMIKMVVVTVQVHFCERTCQFIVNKEKLVMDCVALKLMHTA
jgi:hypothetical protein